MFVDRMWHKLTSHSEVPVDRDLRLAVINDQGVHALVFPCRKAETGWVHAANGRIVEVFPTHWQDWADTAERASA
jgi:hypothetical protein